MQKILVPTDFSLCAAKALEYAVLLARKEDAEILLVHVCDLLGADFWNHKTFGEEYYPSVKKELYHKLNAVKTRLEQTADVAIDVWVEDNDDVPGGILQIAEEIKANLIVMGTQGATGIKKKLFGSIAAQVIRRSGVPVLTVPNTYKGGPPRNMLLAIDDAEKVVTDTGPAFELARLAGAQAGVALFTAEEAESVGVMTETHSIYRIQQKLQRVYSGSALETIHLTGHQFEETLRQFVAEKEVDLLAIATRGRELWGDDSGFSQQMDYYARVPLLSLPARS